MIQFPSNNMMFIQHSYLKLYCCLLLALQLLPQGNGQASLAERHREFADALTNELYVNDNDCTSSWGVSMLFDLLRLGTGSAEDTRNQLCDVIALCGPEDELLWNDTVNMLTTVFDGRCRYDVDGDAPCALESPTLEVVNSIWIDDGSQLQPGYSEIVGEHLLQTDFDSEDAGGIVNSWVNTSTLGLVDSILDTGRIPYDLVAVNSIYLKAYWQEPFSERRTNEDLFFTDASRIEALPNKAHFMHAVRMIGYSDEAIPGYQIIKLDYVDGGLSFVPNEGYCRLSMVIALPFETDVSPVSSETVLAALPSLERRRVALALPKLRIESKYKGTLKTALLSLGFTSAFGGDGFCGLVEGGCQWIDLLIQKTFLEVDENGTVAAAVTAAGLAGAAPPPPKVDLVLADHPFSFFIYSDCEDIILFEGRVGAPTISNDWPSAQLQQKHSDPDFWTSNFDVAVSNISATVVATECGIISDSPGQRVVLENDLKCRGISVYLLANGTSLDCRGYLITYVNEGTIKGEDGIIVAAGAEDVNIVNCFVAGFPRDGILVADGASATIEGSESSHNGRTGLRLEDVESVVHVSHSIFNDNGEAGIYVDCGASLSMDHVKACFTKEGVDIENNGTTSGQAICDAATGFECEFGCSSGVEDDTSTNMGCDMQFHTPGLQVALDNDLECKGNDEIHLSADEIHFDCRGHSVTYVGEGPTRNEGVDGIIVDAGAQNVTLTNCITKYWPEDGILVIDGSSAAIKYSESSHNGRWGLRVEDGLSSARISWSTFNNNGEVGIYVGSGASLSVDHVEVCLTEEGVDIENNGIASGQAMCGKARNFICERNCSALAVFSTYSSGNLPFGFNWFLDSVDQRMMQSSIYQMSLRMQTCYILEYVDPVF